MARQKKIAGESMHLIQARRDTKALPLFDGFEAADRLHPRQGRK